MLRESKDPCSSTCKTPVWIEVGNPVKRKSPTEDLGFFCDHVQCCVVVLLGWVFFWGGGWSSEQRTVFQTLLLLLTYKLECFGGEIWGNGYLPSSVQETFEHLIYNIHKEIIIGY